MTRLRLGAPLWWGLPVLVVVLWAAGSLVAQQFPGLPAPPVIVQAFSPIAGFARDVSALLVVGCLVIGGVLPDRPATRAIRWATTWAVIWLGLVIVQVLVTLSDALAATPLEVIGMPASRAFLLDVTAGRVLVFELVAVAAVALAAGRVASRRGAAIVAAVALSATAAPSFVGHAGVITSHSGATVSLMVHLAAISVWVGGLATLVALLRAEPDRGAELIPRFSLLALWCVILVAESGLLNASLRVGSPTSFVGTTYGSLVLAKVVLLAALIRFGWLQRLRVVSRLDGDRRGSVSLLTRIAGWEMTVMGVAVALGVALARIGPNAPFPGREVYTPLAAATLAVAGPVVLAWSVHQRPNGRWWMWLRTRPEVPAVSLLVVVAEVTGVGILQATLGREVAVIVGSGVLLVVGSLWAMAVDSPRGALGVIIVMIGWPVVTWLSGRLATVEPDWRPSVASVVLVEAILLMWLARVRRPAVALREPMAMVAE